MRAQLAAQPRRDRRARARRCARCAAARRRHLRARQLRPRRHLRQVPDRDAHWACSPPRPRRRSARSTARSQDLRDCLFLAISQSGRSPDLLGRARGARRPPARSWSRSSTPRTRRSRALADHAIPLCAGAGDQRRRDQVVHRLARRDRAPRRRLDATTRRCCDALDGAPDQLARGLGARLERGARAAARRPAAST